MPSQFSRKTAPQSLTAKKLTLRRASMSPISAAKVLRRVKVKPRHHLLTVLMRTLRR